MNYINLLESDLKYGIKQEDIILESSKNNNFALKYASDRLKDNQVNASFIKKVIAYISQIKRF